MRKISSSGIYKTMYHNGKKENDKDFEFHLNNSSYFLKRLPLLSLFLQ